MTNIQILDINYY